ncbi:ATP-binding protein [Devosia insulae]|nr:ATP-binding protein [Devosia insulae]
MVSGYIVALDATLFVTDLITAGLLLAHFSVTRSRALLALACGYFFSAAAVVAHGVTFPEALYPFDAPGQSLRINFRIYLLWHLGIAVGAFAYVWLRERDRDRAGPHSPANILAVLIAAAALFLAACVVYLVLLPPLTPEEGQWLTAVTMLICTAALLALWVRRRAAIDQWLMVVVLAMIVELAITALIGFRRGGSVTVGFYGGRLFSLVTSTVVLTALLAETARLYTGVARGDLLALIVGTSRAISSEIELPKLIERLIRTVLENSEADRAVLVLPTNGGYQAVAEALVVGDRIDVTMRQQPISASAPESIVRQVVLTTQPIVLDDASVPAPGNPFSVGHQRPRSVACLPVSHQGVLSGVLYLEHSTAPRIFTAERVRLLGVLASQAAISLENATLYSDLKRSEAFLAQGQRISRTGAFEWTAATGEVYWSDELYRIMEYDPSNGVTAEHGWERMHPDDREHVQQHVEAAMRNGVDFESEHRLLMPDGRVKYVQSTGRAMGVRNLDFVGSVRDITESIRTETSLRQSQAELAHVARVATLNAMTASIAHEVSQPLTGILTNANTSARFLAADPPDVAGATETVRRTIRDASRAADVIRHLRELLSNKTPTRDLIDLNDATREVIALSSVELGLRQALVRTELATTLPLVLADRVQLQQVILNLLLNAGDAMVEVQDRPRRMLVTTGLNDDGSVQLAVRDCGKGIEAAAIEKLFQPFYTTKANGMGVGLSICRSIIEGHQGRLWVEPNDGPGVTFSFCIPGNQQSNAQATP